MGAPKIILWLLMSVAVIAIICEGIYQLMGNGTFARVLCTVALIAVAPFLLKPFMYRQLRGGQEDDAEADEPQPDDEDK